MGKPDRLKELQRMGPMWLEDPKSRLWDGQQREQHYLQRALNKIALMFSQIGYTSPDFSFLCLSFAYLKAFFVKFIHSFI